MTGTALTAFRGGVPMLSVASPSAAATALIATLAALHFRWRSAAFQRFSASFATSLSDLVFVTSASNAGSSHRGSSQSTVSVAVAARYRDAMAARRCVAVEARLLSRLPVADAAVFLLKGGIL